MNMKKVLIIILVAVLCGAATVLVARAPQNKTRHYYCECCGYRNTNLQSLVFGGCPKNPDGKKHKLYEGGEKDEYYCKYCGKKAESIRSLTSGKCYKDPKGFCKGYHVPAL